MENSQTITPEAIDITELPFTKFGRWYSLPEIAAVYFCLNAEGQVLYVGQSTNLKSPWGMGNCHDKRSGCADLKAVKLAWLETEPENLYQLEVQMIARFDPILNFPPGCQDLSARIERSQQLTEMKRVIAPSPQN